MRSALVKLPGVQSVIVDLKSRVAVIRYDSKMVDPDQLTDTTTKAGFPSRVKESKSTPSKIIGVERK